MLCEVLAMGSPLFYEKLNGLNDAEISSAPTPASNTSLPTLLPTPAPTSIRALKTLTSNVRYTVLDNDRLFLTWDSALDKCQRYGMSPATVRSMAEQAALSAAFYAYHKEHSLDYDNITETLQYSWLGGVYEEDSNSYAYGWYWVDASGAQDLSFGDWNYTNWQDAADMPGDSLSFMYVDAVSMQWSWASSTQILLIRLSAKNALYSHFQLSVAHLCRLRSKA